ncbi:hypothetical protein [Natranaerofaba carboxydovora]|uniref:hypothetical protein n=1 Tax=Natranaerofaba carboxydovora TaxID=2742683 RepID=UPI001F13ADF1|nr:hypothetical protein [Natranaerofaba carboxydovora]UMZ74408.1 hypothetical protein ACONDI_01998 [Natranaerofaba carboxydovora]
MLGRFGMIELIIVSIILIVIAAVVVIGGYFLVKSAVKKGKAEAKEEDIDIKNRNE